ncbi:hypothetical protein PAL_GLEAN10017891 [Pteropus alecto]|uniref:Uncharacterized protein n=1 Tax=Pteropus alecto TaxID=9402 RepID=L5KY53_PTEAL|nr:hypothetical protein PAL_GLEAN10017891 [Pteropus alecto]
MASGLRKTSSHLGPPSPAQGPGPRRAWPPASATDLGKTFALWGRRGLGVRDWVTAKLSSGSGRLLLCDTDVPFMQRRNQLISDAPPDPRSQTGHGEVGARRASRAPGEPGVATTAIHGAGKRGHRDPTTCPSVRDRAATSAAGTAGYGARVTSENSFLVPAPVPWVLPGTKRHRDDVTDVSPRSLSLSGPQAQLAPGLLGSHTPSSSRPSSGATQKVNARSLTQNQSERARRTSSAPCGSLPEGPEVPGPGPSRGGRAGVHTLGLPGTGCSCVGDLHAELLIPPGGSHDVGVWTWHVAGAGKADA